MARLLFPLVSWIGDQSDSQTNFTEASGGNGAQTKSGSPHSPQAPVQWIGFCALSCFLWPIVFNHGQHGSTHQPFRPLFPLLPPAKMVWAKAMRCHCGCGSIGDAAAPSIIRYLLLNGSDSVPSVSALTVLCGEELFTFATLRALRGSTGSILPALPGLPVQSGWRLCVGRCEMAGRQAGLTPGLPVADKSAPTGCLIDRIPSCRIPGYSIVTLVCATIWFAAVPIRIS